jgi:glucokinase
MGRRTDGEKVILAGDIGGTNTRLGLFSLTGGTMQPVIQRTFPGKDHHGLAAILRIFLEGRENIAAACFGVAGPVVRGTAVATNLPWKISIRSLQRELALDAVDIINDLVANAYGIGVMQGRDFVVLNTGRKMEGNAALLSAGTGLGAAILFWNGKKHIPLPSEDGHVEFGPRNRLELDLLKYLFERSGHVSYERVLSGAGLYNIYQFLRDAGRFGKEPGRLTEMLRKGDPPAVIAGAARHGKNRLCSKALDLFVSIYGAAAGNLALQVMAVSGIYIGGGIAPKIIWKLRDGTFMKAFREKGRLASIVERIPVRVIMNDRAALLGAAVRAAKLLER